MANKLVIGLLTVGALGGAYLAVRLAKKPSRELPEGPLRPEPREIERGPLALELQGFIDSLSDDELKALRSAIPDEWWNYSVGATYATTNDGFRFAFLPLTISLETMSDGELSKIQQQVFWAIGLSKARELQRLLTAAGVLPEED